MALKKPLKDAAKAMQQQGIIKVAASSLGFPYDECKSCFWHMHHGWSPPYMPFPTVFTKIDKCMRQLYDGMPAKMVHPDFPEGAVISTDSEGILSVPIGKPGKQVFVTGAIDCKVDYLEPSCSVHEHKISVPSEKNLIKYGRQVGAYNFAYQHPAVGEGANVRGEHAGVLCGEPHSATKHGGSMMLTMDLHWKSTPYVEADFLAMMEGVAEFLHGPGPAGNLDCVKCCHRMVNATRKEYVS